MRNDKIFRKSTTNQKQKRTYNLSLNQYNAKYFIDLESNFQANIPRELVYFFSRMGRENKDISYNNSRVNFTTLSIQDIKFLLEKTDKEDFDLAVQVKKTQINQNKPKYKLHGGKKPSWLVS